MDIQILVVQCIALCFWFHFSYSTCGYQSCHPLKREYINVHLVPHSHDDVGWTKTVDQYYEDVFGHDVRAILTTSFNSLLKNPNRRFIYVESAYFFRWWNEQNGDTQAKYRKLVNNGQLEFVSGAWSMNDEATASYQSIIDQFTLGLRMLNETFGTCGRPRVGWQIDPFGHSSEMASILAQIGFDGLFLGRIDYQDKEKRMSDKNLEMIWQGSKSLGSQSQIFTSVLYNTYFAPEGFSWDMWSGISELNEYNIKHKWSDLVKYMDKQASYYRTKNIILTMGGDFNYMDAERYFRNLDTLIDYANQQQANGSNYNLIYSTPSCYLKAVHDEAQKRGIAWHIKTDDFFPYADEAHSYWTGYFTSRPTLKYFERLGNNFLQVCKQLSVLTSYSDDGWRLNSLKEAMGIMQHHDAVSGTEQEHVSKDYATMLSAGLQNCEKVSSEALRSFVHKPQNRYIPNTEFHSCLLLNISQCRLTENSEKFVVTVYNPTGKPSDTHLRLPVKNSTYTIKDPKGNSLLTQLVPIPKQVLEIPGRNSDATHELVFQALQIPPLGFRSYHVSKGDGDDDHNEVNTKEKPRYAKKQKVKLRIGRRHGFLKKIIVDGKKIPVVQEFYYYIGAPNYPYRPSGAYIFRPWRNKPLSITENASFVIHAGDVVYEVHQTFNSYVSQVVRMYPGTNSVELNWLVGPLPDDAVGREVISHFTTKLKTNGTFFTDSNSRETLLRVRDHRPTWNLTVTEEISGNYYPVTSMISVKDSLSGLEVAVITDRPQGGTSADDGEIELMVHRNTMYDDGLGVVEPLQEKAFGKPIVVRGTHWIVAGDGDTLAELKKDVVMKSLLPFWTFLSQTNYSYDEYRRFYNMEYSGLTSPLPENIKLLTLETISKNTVLLRLEHVYGIDEHSKLSKPVQIKLKDLFTAFTISNVQETTLAGNEWLQESHRIKFGYEKNSVLFKDQTPSVENGFLVVLNAMQIRTFIVTLKIR